MMLCASVVLLALCWCHAGVTAVTPQFKRLSGLTRAPLQPPRALGAHSVHPRDTAQGPT